MKSTGWPPGLLQDDSRKLSDWFASRVDARWTVRRVCAEIERNRMTDKQPEALRLADSAHIGRRVGWQREAAALLRTQHAAIERKDALLRLALEAMYEAQAYTSTHTWSPSTTAELKELCLTINSELSQ